MPIRYKGMVLESDLLLDVVVDGTVVVEGKAAGLLINFNVPLSRDGVKRVLHTPSREKSGANQNIRNRRLPGRNGVEVI